MNKKAFTLIEIAFVCLIVSILFHSMFSLFVLAINRFSHQESHIVMTWEGGMLCSYLSQDFEDAYLSGDPHESLHKISAENGKLTLPIGDKFVEYVFDQRSGQVNREFGKIHQEIGKKLIKQFEIVPEVQFSNGEIKVFSPKSLADAEKARIVPTRIWFKVNLILETEIAGSKTAGQDFGFYAFPVRINRQLQSIWKP